MRPTFRQLELFIALANSNTMSAAAADLHISESALSNAITQLEKCFGTQLCVRRKARGVSLTAAGHSVVAEATKILQQTDDLVKDIAATNGQIVGEVKVGCFDTISATILPPLMQNMLADFPEIHFDIAVGTQEDLLDRLSQGRLHFAFLYDQFLPDHLHRADIYQTEEMVMLREDHPLAYRESITFQELESEPFVLLDATPVVPNMNLLFAEHGIKPNIVAVVPDFDLVRGLVARGVAYAIAMSRPLGFENAFEGHRIVFRPLAPKPRQTGVVAVWESNVELPLRAQLAIKNSQDQFADVVVAQIPE